MSIRLALVVASLLSCFPIMGQNALGGQKGAFAFQYFRVDRQQWGGNTGLQLNDDFEYLQVFKKGQRFAPDEPSTFSSLEYGFWGKTTDKGCWLALSAGVFRNHIKGDFRLNDGQTLHFGRGNSQIGLSSTFRFYAPAFFQGKWTVSASAQLGLGPHFTKLTAGNDVVAPVDWGVRGWGCAGNAGLWLSSPVLFRRLVVDLGTVFHGSASTYQDFSVEKRAGGERTSYSNIHFSNTSRWPRLTVALKFLVFDEKH